MSLPGSWVEKIFQKLMLVYGRDFSARWEGHDMTMVMADWGRELAALERNPAAIRYGLENLPDRPPTVLEFRAICNRRPDPPVELLPPMPADPGLVARVVEELHRVAPEPQCNRAAELLDSLRRLREMGTATPAQRSFLARAEAGLGAPLEAFVGDFRPIAPDLWPEQMRNDMKR